MDQSLNTSILCNFKLPALRSLRLGPLTVSDEQWKQRDLLYPHLSAIRRLSFLGCRKKSETLVSKRIVELLHCAKNVEQLKLCPGIGYQALLEALTVVAPAPTSPTVPASAQMPSTSAQIATPSPLTPILPKLHTLSMDLKTKPTSVLDLFEDRLRSQALKGMVQSCWIPSGGGRRVEEGGQRCEEEAGGTFEEELRVKSGEELRMEEPQVACLKKLQIYLTKKDGPIRDEIHDVLGEYVNEGLIVEERCADTFHWSTRLLRDDPEEVSWPEGLSVLVSESECYSY